MLNDEYYKVSIIMPALNEAKHLPYAFDAIYNLDYPKDYVEVIIVDNGSKDATVDIAKKRGATVIEAPKVKIGELRNLGSKIAKGDIFAFVDSDCEVDVSWLKNALVHLMKKNVGAVGCHTRIPVDSTWIEKTLDFHATRKGVNEVEFLPTANLIVKREVFENVGGFDSSLETGEDSDFCHKIRKLGLLLVSDTDILVIHMDYPKSIRQLHGKEMWHFREVYNLLLSTNFRLEYLISILIPFLYFLCVCASIVLAVKAMFLKSFLLLYVAIVVLFFIPVTLSLYKCIVKGSFKYIFYSSIYFLIVLVARINSSMLFLYKKIYHC